MTTIGIDPSLTATGVVVIVDGRVVEEKLIKSVKMGDAPRDELVRLRHIVDGIVEVLSRHQPDIVLMEGLAFMARNTTALVQLAGLNYFIRHELGKMRWHIVPPSTLKKFLTSKGNSDKNVVMMSILRDYGLEFPNDNLADAFGLAALGAAVLDAPIRKGTLPQQEVAELVKAQVI